MIPTVQPSRAAWATIWSDAEGTSFDTLRDEVRRQAALRYLNDTGYPIAEVAGLLGFSEQSAFTRYCRSKLGGTPTEIRARRRA